MSDTPHDAPFAYSPATAARLLGVSEQTLARRIADGTIRAVRIGRRVLVPRVELERVVAVPGPIPLAISSLGGPRRVPRM